MVFSRDKWVVWNGAAYLFVCQKRDQPGATRACGMRNGTLVKIHSKAENDFLVQLSMNQSCPGAEVWIGVVTNGRLY